MDRAQRLHLPERSNAFRLLLVTPARQSARHAQGRQIEQLLADPQYQGILIGLTGGHWHHR